MKKILGLSFFLASLNIISAQENGKYSFYASEANKNINFTVKGEYQGKYADNDFYYEKVDALNHKIKEVEFLDGKMYSMNSYEVNETLLKVSNLRVQEKKSYGKTFYIVEIETNNDKKPIMYKRYLASKGAFNSDMDKEFKLNVPFATKAKAEAFITDLKNYLKYENWKCLFWKKQQNISDLNLKVAIMQVSIKGMPTARKCWEK